jgi:hypothetical protein
MRREFGDKIFYKIRRQGGEIKICIPGSADFTMQANLLGIVFHIYIIYIFICQLDMVEE